MMRLTETAQGLTIAYPAWVGLLVFALGAALAVWVWRHFTLNGKFLSYCAGTLVALVAGVYFLTYKAELTPEQGRSHALFGSGSARVEWRQARSVVMEERPGKGRPMYIVVDTIRGTRFEINASDLSGSDRARLLAYIRAQIERAAKP